MSWAVRAADGERIPWLDAAYHDRFALHGAGYEERFRSGLDPRLHGMYSDDYITAEVLTGHPPMVNAAFGREVVRQYWLLHGIMRALAMRRIESVEFVGGDPHRQRVLWEGGAEVCVNRGEADWLVGGQVLPQFGFYARIPDGDRVAEAAIERRNGLVVEWAASEDGLYVNGRAPSRFRSVTVSLDSIAWGDDRAIDLALRWQARGPLDAPRRAFVHFVDASDAIRFQSDHDPPVPTTEWRGTIGTSARAVLPDECAAGQSFELRVGLYDPATSTRVPIDGLTDGGRAVRLGQVTLLGEGTAVTGIRWAALDDPEGVLFRARHNPSAEPVSFGALATEGACRLVRSNGDLLVVVLPDGERCSVRLDWNALPWPLTRPRRVALLDESGTALRDEPIGTGASAKWVEDGVLLLRCEPGAFAYRLAPAETSGGM